jgi:hypothetical protein
MISSETFLGGNVHRRLAQNLGHAMVDNFRLFMERKLVDQIFTSSNPLISWLRQIEALCRSKNGVLMLVGTSGHFIQSTEPHFGGVGNSPRADRSQPSGRQ